MDGLLGMAQSAWEWLGRNMEWSFSGWGPWILGLIGSCVLALYKLIKKPVPVKEDQARDHITQSGFSAEGDMVVAGRDITGSVQIQKGYSPEDLHAIFKDQQALSERLGVTEENIRTFFRILEHGEVPREQWPQRLLDIANRHKEALHRLAALRTQDPQSQVWLDQARAAIEAGDYAQAERLLDQAEQSELSGLQDAERLLQQAKEAVAKRRSSAAALRAEKAELFAIQLRYLDAAVALASAAELVAETDPYQRLAYLDQQADMLQKEGDEHGNNTALEQAIAIYQAVLLPELPRARIPLAWATTQNNLGSALGILGERESDTARLEEAVATYRAALEEHTRERVPLDWAMTQNNLGLALAGLGERESGTARLEEAVAAYRAALEEYTRERIPLDWAQIQTKLGLALCKLGERDPNEGTNYLQEARDSFQHAWAVYQDAGMSQYDSGFQQQLDNIETLILSQSDERAEL